jgi:WD40 repeat protein
MGHGQKQESSSLMSSSRTIILFYVVKFSLDGQKVAVCRDMEDYKVFLGLCKLDGTEGACIALEGHTGFVNDLAFSPDYKCLVLSSDDRTIKLCNFRTSRCIQTFTGHADQVKSISFSHDGKFIVSGGVGTIQTWILEGNCLYNINASGAVNSVEFSADGNQVITEENGSIFVRSTAE